MVAEHSWAPEHAGANIWMQVQVHGLISTTCCCSGTYQAEAAQALETKRLQALCVTWNVNERFPEAGCPLFAWLRNTSATCNLAVIGLQEVEMGGGSVAMGTVKDNLFRGMQVRSIWYNVMTNGISCLCCFFTSCGGNLQIQRRAKTY